MLIENRLLHHGTTGSPLGRIIESAIVADAGWVRENPMRILGSFALVLVLEGTCQYIRGDRSEELLTQGDLLVIFPDVPHLYGPAPQSRWSQFYVSFEGPIFDLWRKTGAIDPGRYIYHLQPVDYWLNRFTRLMADLPVTNLFSLQPVCALQSLMAEIFESQTRSPDATQNQRWLQQAHEVLLHLEGGASADLAVAAERMSMSYALFRKKFAKLAQVSPGKYHALLIMRKACELLQERQLSNKEVSNLLGFCNEYHFSRRFKQVIGQSASEFRRRHGGRENI